MWLQGLTLLPVVGKWMLLTCTVCRGKGIPTQVWMPCPDCAWQCWTLCFAAWSLFLVSRISELHFVFDIIFSKDAAVSVWFWLMFFAKFKSSDPGSLLLPSTVYLNPRVIPVPCHGHELNRNSAHSDIIQIYLAASLYFSKQLL